MRPQGVPASPSRCDVARSTTKYVPGLEKVCVAVTMACDAVSDLSSAVSGNVPAPSKSHSACTMVPVPTGTSAAFVTTPEDPEVLPALITYVSEFVPKHSGENYEPHVTTGLAPRTYLDAMLKEPFATFTFSPAGAAVYHLGHYGTAAKKLKQFDLKN